MIIWQKQASAAWLALHQAHLAEKFGPSLALITRAGRSRSLVQIVCRRRGTAGKLRRDFGGTIALLSRNWRLPAPTHPPIRIGSRLKILSEAGAGPDEKGQLLIPPASAFGTGEHATTAMTLRLLEETTRRFSPSWRLFDAGTGTGILALAARRFGAGQALGLDNDPRAIANARQNARLNRIGRVKFVIGDILRFKPAEKYEIVTANLFSELLIAALPILRRALRENGTLILSGILRGQFPSVLAALEAGQLQLVKRRRRGKWIALVAARQKPVEGVPASDTLPASERLDCLQLRG